MIALLLRKNSQGKNKLRREIKMTSLRNFAVQVAATVTLTCVLGVLLFNVADLATRGVVVA